jgi:hypothetical protein
MIIVRYFHFSYQVTRGAPEIAGCLELPGELPAGSRDLSEFAGLAQ